MRTSVDAVSSADPLSLSQFEGHSQQEMLVFLLQVGSWRKRQFSSPTCFNILPFNLLLLSVEARNTGTKVS